MHARRVVSDAALLPAVLLMLVAPNAAQARKAPKPPPPRYTFGGVSWLVPADSARAVLVARGYQPVASASDSQQLVLRGKLFEHDALITGYLDEQKRLLRWVVLLSPRAEPFPYPDMRAVFDDMGRESEARYGLPRTVIEHYSFPYEQGDGHQDNALRDGKAVIRRGWVSVSGDRLTIAMNDHVMVELTYECREWEAFVKRRQAKRASDL